MKHNWSYIQFSATHHIFLHISILKLLAGYFICLHGVDQIIYKPQATHLIVFSTYLCIVFFSRQRCYFCFDCGVMSLRNGIQPPFHWFLAIRLAPIMHTISEHIPQECFSTMCWDACYCYNTQANSYCKLRHTLICVGQHN